MLGVRLKKANIIARRRYKRFLAWGQLTNYDKYKHKFGPYRKTNVSCSCSDCGNPRRSWATNNVEKLTKQERRAPNVCEDWG